MQTTGMLLPYLDASYNHLRVTITLTKSTEGVVLQLLNSTWIFVTSHYTAMHATQNSETIIVRRQDNGKIRVLFRNVSLKKIKM